MKQSETMLIQFKNGIQHIVFRKFPIYGFLFYVAQGNTV